MCVHVCGLSTLKGSNTQCSRLVVEVALGLAVCCPYALHLSERAYDHLSICVRLTFLSCLYEDYMALVPVEYKQIHILCVHYIYKSRLSKTVFSISINIIHFLHTGNIDQEKYLIHNR